MSDNDSSDLITSLFSRQGGPRPKGKPKPKEEPGLTGADLEMAKAQREYDAADKTAGTATSDFINRGGYSLGHMSYAGPERAMRAYDRQQAANGSKDQAREEIGNIAALRARLAARTRKP